MIPRQPPIRVTRTVRKGRVKVGRKLYHPSEKYMPYDGRFEGMRLSFGRYFSFNGNKWEQEPYLFLTGFASDLGWDKWVELATIEGADKSCYFYWDWWNEVEET